MATVIGIFEQHYKDGKPLPIVKPGTQSRRFTHIYDTVQTCFLAWKNNRCKFLISDSYIFDTGIGISEKIHHNSITKNVKNIVTDNIFKSKSYLRSLW